MSAISAPAQLRQSIDENADFLKLLPAMENHASVSFRHLPETAREEAIAEATAAAFVNYDSARRRGNLNMSLRFIPSSLFREDLRISASPGRSATTASCESRIDLERTLHLTTALRYRGGDADLGADLHDFASSQQVFTGTLDRIWSPPDDRCGPRRLLWFVRAYRTEESHEALCHNLRGVLAGESGRRQLWPDAGHAGGLD